MFGGLLAMVMMFQAASPDPHAAVKAAWNTSPTGAGSAMLSPARDSRDGWETHDLVGRHDWLRFQYINGAPSLLLNTPGKIVYSLQGTFTVTNSTAVPFMVEFTATDTGGTDWGTPLVVTVTQ